MYPSMNEKMQAGLVNAYKESGFLPEWASPGHRDCMVGNNSASIVADAYLCGLKNYDAEKLWEAVVHGTKAVHPTVSSTGRLGYEYYNKLGYVPYDVKINENVARTLEYAYDDWCIYQFGKQLGKSKKELEPFRKRAFNYRNVFDKETNLMRGRLKNGEFQKPFSPLKWGDAFTEGNAWHYTWSVFHDPQGLIDLMGGKQVFNQMLDSVFNVPPLFDDSYYGAVIVPLHQHQRRSLLVRHPPYPAQNCAGPCNAGGRSRCDRGDRIPAEKAAPGGTVCRSARLPRFLAGCTGRAGGPAGHSAHRGHPPCQRRSECRHHCC